MQFAIAISSGCIMHKSKCLHKCANECAHCEHTRSKWRCRRWRRCRRSSRLVRCSRGLGTAAAIYGIEGDANKRLHRRGLCLARRWVGGNPPASHQLQTSATRAPACISLRTVLFMRSMQLALVANDDKRRLRKTCEAAHRAR